MTGSQAKVTNDHQPRKIIDRFLQTRSRSLELCANLSPEDMQVQSMEDASPTKWHLAHTTWFFETFILKPFLRGYCEFDREFEYLFNSYYNGVGPQFKRAKRGLLTRPGIDVVKAYRNHVDAAIQDWFLDPDCLPSEEIASLLEMGIQHEQQHQELMLTDIKHAFFQNPTFPSILPENPTRSVRSDQPLEWIPFEEGVYTIGYHGDGFYFDNERPAHRVFLEPFRLAPRLTNNAEFLAFVESGGYERPEFWLSEAWQILQKDPGIAPLYWRKRDNEWFEFTLNGLQPLDLGAPVMHVNYYEADAFARWSGKRLPTEQEWEVAFGVAKAGAEVMSPGSFAATSFETGRLQQMLYCAWQWTSSSYAPYPGYRPVTGAIGEYNGKFMVNQYVLRGGSIATPGGHIRNTYRNFFYPDASWQFSGIRLADSE